MISGRIREVFVTSLVPMAAGVVAGGCAVAVVRWMTQPWAALLVGALVGAVVYGVLTLRWARSTLARARRAA